MSLSQAAAQQPGASIDKILQPDRQDRVVPQWSKFDLATSLQSDTKFRNYLRSVPVAAPASPKIGAQLDKKIKAQRVSPLTPIEPVPFTDNLLRPTSYKAAVNLSGDGDEKADLDTKELKAEPVSAKSNKTYATIEITTEDLAKRIEEQKKLITDNEALDEPAKTEQLEQLNAASIQVQKAKTLETSIQERQQLLDNYDSEIKAKEDELKQMSSVRQPEKDASSDDLQAQLREKRADIQADKADLEAIASEIEQRDKRVEQIPGIKTAALEKLKKIDQGFVDLADQPDDIYKTLSTLALDAQKLATEKEIKALDIESRRLEQVKVLLPLDREIYTREITRLETEIEAWDIAFNERRDAEIAKQRKEAEEAVTAAIAADPKLKLLAETNNELAIARAALAKDIQTKREELDQLKTKQESLDSKFKLLKQKIEKGMTPANGALLIEHRQNLSQPYQSQIKINEINELLQNSRSEDLKLVEKREQLDEIETTVAKLEKNQAMARELVETQKTYLNDLDKDYTDYIELLSDVSNLHNTFIKKINESREYIDRNAMWIRSSEPLWASKSETVLHSPIENTASGVRSLLGTNDWANVYKDIQSRIYKFPFGLIVTVILLLGVFFINWRLRENHG